MTISEKNLENLLHNPEAAATFADLIYVTEEHLTIARKRNKDGFTYDRDGKAIKTKKILKRIDELVIPPAWEEVLIAEPENGHLQAVGRDDKSRKVYLYHANWSKLRNETKFFKMAAFANILPQIRKQVDADLDEKEMTQRKVLALVIRLMEETHIRIGNESYARNNKTYGLSTLRNRHVKTTSKNMVFKFVGKKSVEHEVSIDDKRLVELVNQCEEIPGWELFQYYDEDGTKHRIDSGMVNDYIHDISGDLFSAKDFRTWAATVIFFEKMRELGYIEEEKQNAKNLLIGYDAASEGLGNTRDVVRNYYVHPHIVKSYETGDIVPYFEKAEKLKASKAERFSPSEKVITEMLGKYEVNF
ncbi:DNA topoisomerase IB [Flavimarina sp. Hel_I_48]|uniref:DNA topoisomerase IB n=1 Tax=Flavimarina sp. Hel_I_48 TaxID=1392488 RepID=UPI0004DF4228|nr:DNA topoisomerase IB [Flavimarina sp. Hel_I_48]